MTNLIPEIPEFS